jgi:hypothetical protein
MVKVRCDGGGRVKSYRIYIVGSDGRLQLGQAFEAPDDRTAGALAAGAAVNGLVAELWEGGRMVGQVSTQGVFNMGDRSAEA